MRILICGAGVIGACIAYFLSRRGVEAIVVERTAVACAASGKSGGFLALDWCDESPLQPLARRSFALHAKLAEELGGDWLYRRLTTYAGQASVGGKVRRGREQADLPWLALETRLTGQLGSTATTAQVDPAGFTAAILAEAQRHGAQLRIGEVTGLLRHGTKGRVEGVMVDGEALRGDAVVIAMGPWSVLAAGWMPLPAVYGLKGHSLIFETGSKVPAEALFLECREASGGVLAPEIFPRSDGTTYVCGISGEDPLPLDPAAVSPDARAIERLHAACAAISPALAAAKIRAAQACYRPVTRDGLPLIGPVPGVPGAYVATGHSVWGILNAPATGEAVAELITEGRATCVDLSPFAPGRLPALDPSRLRM